jgi:hypothetical protein
MSDGFDLSGLDRLAADLNGAGNAVIPFAVKALAVTSMNVKKTWQGKVSGASGMPGLAARSPTTSPPKAGRSRRRSATTRTATRDRSATSASSVHRPSPPAATVPKALQENADDFVHGLERAVEDALKSRDL